jgi:type IV pilus assembly protein PilC
MAEQARIFLVWLAVFLFPLLLIGTVFYCVLSRPLKRNEQTRLFLDLLLHATKSKKPLETWIIEISRTQDKSMGIGFHLLAAYIEEGESFAAAIKKTPWFLPGPVRGMLLAGIEIGKLPAAVSGAKAFLQTSVSKAQGAFHYVVALTLCLLPLFFLSPIFIKIFVIPKLIAISADMETSFPPQLQTIVSLFPWSIALQAGLVTLAFLFGFFYLEAHRRILWLDRWFGSFADRLNMSIPWKRKRSIRSFSTILCLLLDAKVHETQALEMAGEFSGNRVLKRSGRRMAERIRAGNPLPEALESLSTRSDFKWRFSVAARTQEGFAASLAGWHEALEAEAFRSEQGTAQILSSLMIICLGAIVFVIVSSVFLLLNHILERAVLW